MKETRELVVDVLKKYTFNPQVWETATDDSKIIDDLKINSARVVDISLDIEDIFDIEVEDDELEKLVSIKDILLLLDKKIS